MAARREIQKTFDELNLMPINQAAERYYCSRRTLARAIEIGKIESYKPGKERLVDVDSADIWFLSKKESPKRKHGNRKR